jgi:nucleotide-binding universal stress UspA family protein
VVVPDGAGVLDGPILIAYDGSAAARQAIEVVGRLLSGRTALVVHVWESQFRHSRTIRSLANAPGGDVREIIDKLDMALAEAAAETTEQGVALARGAGLEAKGETIEASGGVWRALTAHARARDAAIIATGARGIGGARSALLGSVSSGLIHNAEGPILIAHAAS